MKKKLTNILVVVLMIMNFSVYAQASASYLSFSGNCNVRSGPGLTYSILGSVNSGSTLDYNGRTRYDNRGIAWYSVPFGYGEGWVSSVYASFANRGGIATYGGGANGSWESTYYNVDDEDITFFVEATNGDTHVRTCPGLRYNKLDVMYEGAWAEYADDVSYDNRGLAWYAVYWGDNIAWVSSVYTSLCSM